LVCLENTTNKGGGACYDFAEISKIRTVCDTHKLGLHLDGARLMNAIVAKKENPKDYGKVFDTISICLSKGLGAPLGTVLVGKSSIMKNAIRIRKVLGGGMRQVGFMAAAGLYALKNQKERLSEDHDKAKDLAKTLAAVAYVKLVEPTETNIVIFYLVDGISEEKFMADLEEKGVRISNMGHGKLRIVTHHDYTSEMHDKFVTIISSYSS
jgi:threonine aldolase